MTPGIEISGGSLGQIPGVAVGRALGIRRNGPDHNDRMVYVLLGDGECNEGSVWEAFMAAGHYRLDNLVFVIDYNKVQAKGFVSPGHEPSSRWPTSCARSTSTSARSQNGHDVAELVELFNRIGAQRRGKPVCRDPQHGQGQEGRRVPVQPQLAHLRAAQAQSGRLLAAGAVGAGRPAARHPARSSPRPWPRP